MTTPTEALRLALAALTYKGDYCSRDRHTMRQTAIEAVRAALNALPAGGEPAAAPKGAEAQPTRADLIAALTFYANGGHFNLSDESAWDTVSGEPQNWHCDEAGTATIEDGSLAKMALQGRMNADHFAALERGDDFDLDDAPATPAPAAPQADDLAAWVQSALSLPACDRLREWAAIGPAQLAAVESLAEMIRMWARGSVAWDDAAPPAPAAPQQATHQPALQVAAPPAQAPAPAACQWCCGTGRFADHDCRFCAGKGDGSVFRTQAPAVAPPEPLTDAQAQALWVGATINRTDLFGTYLRGLRDGEAAHGIRLDDGGGV